MFRSGFQSEAKGTDSGLDGIVQFCIKHITDVMVVEFIRSLFDVKVIIDIVTVADPGDQCPAVVDFSGIGKRG
ncbi:hypothetical protein D3C85_1380960 [compost metagenome]